MQTSPGVRFSLLTSLTFLNFRNSVEWPFSVIFFISESISPLIVLATFLKVPTSAKFQNFRQNFKFASKNKFFSAKTEQHESYLPLCSFLRLLTNHFCTSAATLVYVLDSVVFKTLLSIPLRAKTIKFKTKFQIFRSKLSDVCLFALF